MDPTVAHIFWDNSNIFIRAQDACDDRRGGGFEPGHRLDARINFPALFDLARADRTVEKAVAVGSVPPALQAIWERLGRVGMIVDLQERGAQTGREQGVDQALQLEMMNSLADRDPPAVAVLLSGDGGFRPTVDRLLKKGWGVEVLSFRKGFSRHLRIGNAPGGRMRYVELDPWYRQIVYLQDPSGEITRPTELLDLTGQGHRLDDQGYALLQRGDYSAAIPLLRRAVSNLRGTGPADPYEAYANYNLGYGLLQTGQCSTALGPLEAANQLETSPLVDEAIHRAQACTPPGS